MQKGLEASISADHSDGTHDGEGGEVGKGGEDGEGGEGGMGTETFVGQDLQPAAAAGRGEISISASSPSLTSARPSLAVEPAAQVKVESAQ